MPDLEDDDSGSQQPQLAGSPVASAQSLIQGMQSPQSSEPSASVPSSPPKNMLARVLQGALLGLAGGFQAQANGGSGFAQGLGNVQAQQQQEQQNQLRQQEQQRKQKAEESEEKVRQAQIAEANLNRYYTARKIGYMDDEKRLEIMKPQMEAGAALLKETGGAGPQFTDEQQAMDWAGKDGNIAKYHVFPMGIDPKTHATIFQPILSGDMDIATLKKVNGEKVNPGDDKLIIPRQYVDATIKAMTEKAKNKADQLDREERERDERNFRTGMLAILGQRNALKGEELDLKYKHRMPTLADYNAALKVVTDGAAKLEKTNSMLNNLPFNSPGHKQAQQEREDITKAMAAAAEEAKYIQDSGALGNQAPTGSK